MRIAFQEELTSISGGLLEMTTLVKVALGDASTAILDSNLVLAEKVIASDALIDQLQHDLDMRTIDVIARQQPVAIDLRTLVTTLRISADLERMGDLAHHVAKQARMRFPECAVPPELIPTITSMARTASALIDKLSVVIENRDIVRAKELESDDDEMDALHRELIAILLQDDWRYGIETAIDMTLVGRYYERFADHAVSIARRVYFLVTGEYNTVRE